MDCIFCKIIAGEIPSKKVFENEHLLAFYDIAPQAPVHIVIIPKTHISSMDELCEENASVVAEIFKAVSHLSKELKLEKGYRVVCNCGEEGGQTVGHLHYHLLAGRNLSWPPG